MLLKNKLFLLLILFTVLFSTVAYAEMCEVAHVRTNLKKMLFEYFESPSTAQVELGKVKDLLDFYLTIPAQDESVECSGVGTNSGVSYEIIVDEGENLTTAVPVCSDGTEFGTCSTDKPSYCYNGRLINKCSICDCDTNVCQEDGSCQEVVTNETNQTSYCGDGTCDADESCNNCLADCGSCSVENQTDCTNVGDYDCFISTSDGCCPSGCAAGADYDCCLEAGKYILETPWGFGCYTEYYNTNCSAGQECITDTTDGCCANWCAAGSDRDCCENVGKCWIDIGYGEGCYDCSAGNETNQSSFCGDGTCDTDENCTICEADCGTCISCTQDDQCQFGFCLNDTCHTFSVCTDYDFGQDYYTKSYVAQEATDGVIKDYFDECWGSDSVLENFCTIQGDTRTFFVYDCPTTCQNGACVNETG